MMHRYTKEHGSYYFYAGDRILFMADEIAVAFDYGSWTMLKHGPVVAVEAWVRDLYETCARHRETNPDVDMLTREVAVLASNDFPVEELNKMIANTTYIETFAKKHGWQPEEEM